MKLLSSHIVLFLSKLCTIASSWAMQAFPCIRGMPGDEQAVYYAGYKHIGTHVQSTHTTTDLICEAGKIILGAHTPDNSSWLIWLLVVHVCHQIGTI